MSARNIQNVACKLVVCGALLVGLFNVGAANAAFPYDLDSGVVFTEINVPGLPAFMASMEETATLEAGISGGTVILRSDRANVWPRASGQNGAGDLSCCNANAWAFIRVNGVWHGATWEFLRVGSTTRDLSALRGNGHLRFAPLGTYPSFPAGVESDDVVGLMVAGITRNRLSFNNIRERSNIVFVNRRTGQVLDPVEDLGFPPEGGVIAPTVPAIISPIINTILED